MEQVGLHIQLAVGGLSHIVGKMVIFELIPMGSLDMQSTNGRRVSQSRPLFSTVFASMSINVLLNLSTNPSVWGWYIGCGVGLFDPMS